MKYVIRKADNIITNVASGKVNFDKETHFSIDQPKGFGSVGQYYSADKSECFSLTRGDWEIFNVDTESYVYDDSRIDEARVSMSAEIQSYCETQDANNFEYPAESGKFYKQSRAIPDTVDQAYALGLSDDAPIPVTSTGGKYGYYDTVEYDPSAPLAGFTAFTVGEFKSLKIEQYNIPMHNFTICETHIGTCVSGQTTEAVVTYDYKTGWR